MTPAALVDGAPGAGAVMAQAPAENFTVASRLLPRRARGHLLALYGYARLVDDAGDEAAGDRSALLDAIARDLERVFAGAPPEHPLMRRLQPTVEELGLARDPFLALLQANRQDQRVRRYASWDELQAYCALSANPVGRLVLAVLGQATPERVALSDAVCTGLQLVEHCQDVAEDVARDRVYLPLEDLERFGCTEADLHAAHAGPALRQVVAFEVDRARRLLDRGAPLARTLRGRQRWAVAGFVGGGRAALDAVERAGHDVLAGPPRATRRARGAALLRALVRA